METLEHHWDSLPDSRKQTLAQMAVLTRWMSFPGALQRTLHVCSPVLNSLKGSSLLAGEG